jgi:lantibiotic biosynthesis protein
LAGYRGRAAQAAEPADAMRGAPRHVVAAARAALTEYAEAGPAGRVDAGPVLLAAALGADPGLDLDTRGAVAAATRAWLADVRMASARPDAVHGGLFGPGLAGIHLGAHTAAVVLPGPAGHEWFSRVLPSTREALVTHCARTPWQNAGVSWSDYDLVAGPAGAVIALAVDPASTHRDAGPALAHLLRLADTPDVHGFRVGPGRAADRHDWNHGLVNTGLAHGVAGVALALCAAARAYGLDEPIANGLRRLADWLVLASYPDGAGVISWAPAGPVDAPMLAHSPRQAWCHGTPGVSWALWAAGEVLDDTGLRSYARSAFESYLAAPDTNTQLTLYDSLGACHGDAGLLVLCDAFARHTDLPAAERRRDLLLGRLYGCLGLAAEWMTSDPSMLTGAAGMLTALLAVTSGGSYPLRILGVC